MRSSLRSWCAAERVDYDVAELLLGHTSVKGGAHVKAYDREPLLPHRREVLEKWAIYLAGEGEAARAA